MTQNASEAATAKQARVTTGRCNARGLAWALLNRLVWIKVTLPATALGRFGTVVAPLAGYAPAFCRAQEMRGKVPEL